MNLQKTTQLPINLQSALKSDVRTQFAALCFRVSEKGKAQVLLITSRGTGRWIIPRGWPMDNKTPAEAALIEAWEEAGVKGKVYETPLGLYSYTREVGEDGMLPCVAMVYPVKVKKLEKGFPENGQRERKWASTKKAANLVSDTELGHIISNFDPELL